MKRLCLTLFLVRLLGADTIGVDARVPELLGLMTKAYSGLHAIHVVARREDANGKSLVVTDYEFAEKAGGRYFVKVKQGDDEIIKVSNGEKTWKAIPRSKQYSEIDAAGSSPSDEDPNAPNNSDIHTSTRTIFLRYRHLAKFADNPEYVKDDQIKIGKEKFECSVLRLTIKGTVNELWIEKQRGFVLQLGLSR